MLRENFDPGDILSLVEGEMSGDEARELEARIMQSDKDRALYEDLKLNVSILRNLPCRDAPVSVWDHLEAIYDETLEKVLTEDPGSRDTWSKPALRPASRLIRIWRPAVAAACLLVALTGGIWFFRGSTPPPPRSPIQWVAKVFPEKGANARSLQAAFFDFMTKDRIRYRGVSPDFNILADIPERNPERNPAGNRTPARGK